MTDQTKTETPEETPEEMLTEDQGEQTPEEPEVAGETSEGEEPSMAGDAEPPTSEAPDAPENPNYMGDMESGELAMMTTLRQQTRKVQTDIGGLEIQKARLIGNLGQLEQQLEHHLNMVGQRLGVPQGTQFQVAPDGKCYKMPEHGQMPQGLRMVHGDGPHKG